MPIPLMGMPPIQSAPFDLTTALMKAMQARYQSSLSALNEAKEPYAGQQALADLINQQNVNKYYGPNIESEIALRGAQTGLAKEETDTGRYKREHGLLDPETVQMMKYLGTLSQAQDNQPTVNQPVNTPAVQQSQPVTQQQSPLVHSLGNLVTSQVANPGQSTPLQSSLTGAIQGQTPNVQPPSPPVPAPTPVSPIGQGTLIPGMNQLQDAYLRKQLGLTGNELYKQKSAQAFNWVHSPVEAKTYEIAQLAGAGIDPSEAVQMLSSGDTVPDILRSKGFDPNNPPEPDFLPTKGNIQQLNQRKAALKEVDTLTDFISKGLGPYSQTIMGYSPLQIKDAITGMNKDRQVDFLAARMIVPELGNARLMLANGRTGITAVQQITDKSLANGKALQGLVTPDVFEKAQLRATEKLKDAFGKATKSYTVGKNKEAKSEPDKSQFTIKMYDDKGNKVLVHSEDLDEALKSGYKKR